MAWWCQAMERLLVLVLFHYSDRPGAHISNVIMSAIASQSRCPACLLNRLFWRRSKKLSKLRVTDFVRGIHRSLMDSPHKRPVTRKCFHLMTSSWVPAAGANIHKTKGWLNLAKQLGQITDIHFQQIPLLATDIAFILKIIVVIWRKGLL